MAAVHTEDRTLVIPSGPAVRYEDSSGRRLLLPPDYDQLTREGQRLARINACRDISSPADAALSWACFRDYYLAPDPDSGFDPAFYQKPYLPTPPFHYKLVEWLHTYDCVAVQSPRGSAKSTMRRSLLLWKALCWPGTELLQILAKDDFVVRDSHRLRVQLEMNERILADFGSQRPPRGQGIWSGHTITLRCGSIIDGLSIEGRMRGMRPTLAVLDDVEADEEGAAAKRSSAELTETICRVIEPMLDSQRKLMVLGTFIGRNSFLYRVVCTDDDSRFQSVDRGGRWFKVNIPAEDRQGRSCWSAKYTKEFLDSKRRSMGSAFFSTEYLGDPQVRGVLPAAVRPPPAFVLVGPLRL